MTTDEELRRRFRSAADEVPVPPGDVDAVRARARQRQRGRRVAGATTAAALLVLAVVGIGRLAQPSRPVTIDPVGDPTTSLSSTPSPFPSASPTAAAATLALDHVRYGVDGVVEHRSGKRRTLTTARVDRAIGTAEGDVVVQAGTGAAIVLVSPGDGERTLVGAEPGSRLRAVADGAAWFTSRLPSDAEGNEEHLRSVPLTGGEVVDHGVSAGVEVFTDALAFLPGDGLAWLSCHLQCDLFVGDLDGLLGRGEARRLTDHARWLAGLAAGPDGRRLAFVDGPDPVVGDGPSELVVVDVVTGAELARIVLPGALELSTVQVAFTDDGDTVVVGDHANAFVVTDPTGDPGTARLDGDAGVTLHGRP